jgi:TatD DNase family protein
MNYYDLHTHHRPADQVMAIQNIMNPDAVEETLKNDGYYSIGIHPWHIHPDHWKEDIETLRKHIQHPKVLALGEAGLDRLVDLPLVVQQDVFQAMVELSEEAKKPLIIHSVKTHSEIVMMYRTMKPVQPWIIHGFNVRWTIAEGMLQHNMYLSIGASVLSHHSSATDVVTRMPLEKLFIETDERPELLQEIYQRVALLKGITVTELLESIRSRFEKLFGYVGS